MIRLVRLHAASPLIACALALWAGCLREASQRCGSGGVCPPGLLCVDSGDTSVGGQVCARSSCGDGRLDLDEVCDDGNNRSGDGCPADCLEPCGDGVRDPDEACDDGEGPSCSPDCTTVLDGFLVSPPQVSFEAAEGTPLPPAALVRVRLAPGDAVLAGYPSGALPPRWLSIAERSSGDGNAELELRVLDTSEVGHRSASVRLQISHQHGTALEVVNLPVTYDVASSDLAVAAAPSALAFYFNVGQLAPPAQTVELTFNGDEVALAAAPPWLSVSPSHPSETSPAVFDVRISDISFPAGTELAGTLVFRTTRAPVSRSSSVPVRYRVLSPHELVLEAMPSAVSFTGNAGGLLPPPQQVTATFNGASVAVVAAPPWITISGPATPGLSPASFTLAVATAAFAAGSVQTGALVLRTENQLRTRELTVPLEYHLRSLPEVEQVAPYVGVAGRGGQVLLRGRGFPTTRTVTVRLGELQLDPVVPDSATQISLDYPPLPAGRHPVTLFDLPDRSPNGATLLIVPPPQYAYQALPAVIAGPRSRIVYDAERQALYAVRRYEEMIEHFAYVEGTWGALPPRVVLGLSDIAMAADGRALLVIDEHAVYEMPLRDGLSTPVFRVAVPGENCTLERAAAANNGTFFLVGRYNGSGSCTGRIYDARSNTLSSSQRSFTDGVVESSADGRRVYIGSWSAALEVYDSLTGAMSWGPSGDVVQRLSVSGNASRAILNDIYVISSDFASVASLPRRSPGGALASRDSSRVFVYGQGQAGARLDIYGLDVPPLQNGTLALLHSISLPDKASLTGQDAVTMTGTPDDSVVFIAGNSKLLVVPIAASP